MKEQTLITLKKPDPTGHGEMSTPSNITKVILNTWNWTLLTQGMNNSELSSKIEQIVLNMAVIL